MQFALVGDFFDILSPAGPVSSEPIMARFISVATGTGYSDALSVRTVAKYVKSGAQLTVSVTLDIIGLFGAPQTDALLITLVGAVGGLLFVGIALVRLRGLRFGRSYGSPYAGGSLDLIAVPGGYA